MWNKMSFREKFSTCFIYFSSMPISYSKYVKMKKDRLGLMTFLLSLIN